VEEGLHAHAEGFGPVGPMSNQTLLQRSPPPGRSMGALAALRAAVAHFMVNQTSIGDRAAVSPTETEAFLAQLPATAARRSSVLGHYFRWARNQRLVLADPTRRLQAP